jgi:hypothetical protein
MQPPYAGLPIDKSGLYSFERVVTLLESGGREFTFGIPIAGVVTTVVVHLFAVKTFSLEARLWENEK